MWPVQCCLHISPENVIHMISQNYLSCRNDNYCSKQCITAKTSIPWYIVTALETVGSCVMTYFSCKNFTLQLLLKRIVLSICLCWYRFIWTTFFWPPPSLPVVTCFWRSSACLTLLAYTSCARPPSTTCKRMWYARGSTSCGKNTRSIAFHGCPMVLLFVEMVVATPPVIRQNFLFTPLWTTHLV